MAFLDLTCLLYHLPKSCYGSCMSAHCLLSLCLAHQLLPGHPCVCSGCTRSVARDGERHSFQLPGASARACHIGSGFLCSSRQHLLQAPSSSGNSAVPSIYLQQEQSPKGDFAVSCKKGILLQSGKTSTESDHRRLAFNSRGAVTFKTENVIEWNYCFAISSCFN